MDCTEARPHLLDARRGALDSDRRRALDEHLAGCAVCRAEDAADRALSTALEQRLDRPRAPASLRASLEARWAPPRRRFSVAPWMRTAGAMSAGAALAFAALLAVVALRDRAGSDAMISEAVNDHLRVLYSQRPIEIESGGIHQVKPWFEGRLDFAPTVTFAGDDDFPLQGGSVAYFVDRKAATFVFKRRLHLITLFVFPAEGLHWPMLRTHRVGVASGVLETSRGFHTLLWRQGDLGYALVSDVGEADLQALGERIATQ
jgi:anti-sigma factor RsiW